MNVNDLAKKALEWFAIALVGFYIGVVHVAQLAYRGLAVPPDWYLTVSGYQWPIVGIVLFLSALWIGLDYLEYRINDA